MYKIIFFFLSIFLSLEVHSIDTKAKQAVVIDFDTMEVLFDKNANHKVIPASMTKIMTVYVAFDRIKNTDYSISKKCMISSKAYKMGGSRTFLEINDQVSVDDLLKGIIVQSGNDASIALAECLAGTEEDFSKLMNVYAERLGMKNTNFVNSSGWPNEKHYSSVYDIAILSNALIKHFPDLYTYFSMDEFTYNEISQPNRNKLLKKVEGTDGLKTGFTKKSGWGIAVSSKRNNRRITVVINGTNSSISRLNESANLLNWAFDQTSQKVLIEKGQFVQKADVWLGAETSVNLVSSKKIVSTLSYDQIQLMKSTIEYTKPIKAPIIQGQEIGKLIINIDGKPDILIPLIAEKNISKVNPFIKIISAAKYLLFGNSLDE
ncbi:D-alanyl-D-alanine carboxypeptidase [Pelagibacteraceae bacterium]|nr:D-alanyl-D-alanine carboxypeptidase [Pelagibacteraceae bacterium]